MQGGGWPRPHTAAAVHGNSAMPSLQTGGEILSRILDIKETRNPSKEHAQTFENKQFLERNIVGQIIGF